MHQHYKIYKPYGYLSQFMSNDSYQQRKKKFLGELGDFTAGAMAIGRLDEQSEGLLLITTDGALSNHVNSRKVEKEYYAQVDGLITAEAINLMSIGVVIGIEGKKYKTKPCKVEQLTEIPELPIRSKRIRDDRHGPTCWISVTITEGKFRQVRKMTSAVGFPTLRLVRVRVGSMTIDGLDAGDIQPLTITQIDAL